MRIVALLLMAKVLSVRMASPPVNLVHSPMAPLRPLRLRIRTAAAPPLKAKIKTV